jgi:hypothetical protein
MSGEYDLKLDRIRKLLDTSHGQGWAFVPRAPLTEQTLVEWEAEYGVALPEEYRLFLREIADYRLMGMVGSAMVIGVGIGAIVGAVSGSRRRQRAEPTAEGDQAGKERS